MERVMGKAWVKARRRDPYYRAAKEQGLRSRAVWKLVQIQQRFGLIHEGDTIVDCGAAPGGWSRAAAEMVGPKGRVIAVDRVAMAPIERGTLIRGDFMDPGVIAKILPAPRAPAEGAPRGDVPRFQRDRPVVAHAGFLVPACPRESRALVVPRNRVPRPEREGLVIALDRLPELSQGE